MADVKYLCSHNQINLHNKIHAPAFRFGQLSLQSPFRSYPSRSRDSPQAMSGRLDPEGGWPAVDLAPATLDPPPCQDDLDLARPTLRDPDPRGLERPAGEPCGNQPPGLLPVIDPMPGMRGSDRADDPMPSREHTDLGPPPMKKLKTDDPELPDFEELAKAEVVFEEPPVPAPVNEAVAEVEEEAPAAEGVEAEALVHEVEAEGPGGGGPDGDGAPPRENLDVADQGWTLRIRFRKSGAQAGHRVLNFIGPNGTKYASKAKAQEGGMPDGLFPDHL